LKQFTQFQEIGRRTVIHRQLQNLVYQETDQATIVANDDLAADIGLRLGGAARHSLDRQDRQGLTPQVCDPDKRWRPVGDARDMRQIDDFQYLACGYSMDLRAQPENKLPCVMIHPR
jgi:hypothetical protein